MTGKLIGAGTLVLVFFTMLYLYGAGRYDAGYDAATSDQREAADKLAAQAKKDKEDSDARIRALEEKLSKTSDELEKENANALQKDPSYRAWRDQPVHPTARSRIWGLREPAAPGNGGVRTP